MAYLSLLKFEDGLILALAFYEGADRFFYKMTSSDVYTTISNHKLVLTDIDKREFDFNAKDFSSNDDFNTIV